MRISIEYTDIIQTGNFCYRPGYTWTLTGAVEINTEDPKGRAAAIAAAVGRSEREIYQVEETADLIEVWFHNTVALARIS